MSSRHENEVRALMDLIRRCYVVVNAAAQLDVIPYGWERQHVDKLHHECEMVTTYSQWVEAFDE